MADEATTETTAEAAPPTPPPPAAAPPQAAPWTADLEQYITDPAAREQADRYMREKVQPRITQLEDSPAQRLYKDLVDSDKQDVTVAAIVSQIYGEEYADRFIASFGEEGEGLEEGQTIEEGVAEVAESGDDPDKAWVAQKRAEEEQQQADQEYDGFLSRVVSDEGNAEWRTLVGDPTFTLTEADKPLLGPFMASSETAGEAVQKYAEYVKRFAAAHNMTPAAAIAEEAKEPPATLGSAGSTAATPPTEPPPGKWEDIGQLAADYVKEQTAKKAPPATL